MATPRRQRARDDGPRVRDRLIDAGTRLFSERGYAATSVGAICEQAGVGKPALYWHFDSKEGLLAAVLGELSSRRIDRVRKSASTEVDASRRLGQMVEAMRRLVLDDPSLLRLPILAALEQAAESDATREAVIGIWNESAEALVGDLAAATGRSRQDLEDVAIVALGLLSAASVRFSIDGDLTRLDRSFAAMERAVRLMLTHAADEGPREEG